MLNKNREIFFFRFCFAYLIFWSDSQLTESYVGTDVKNRTEQTYRKEKNRTNIQ
jgi:hypothetical protein